MIQDTPVIKRKSLTVYSDLNRNFGEAGAPDLLFDSKAISQSLYNIFLTSIGEAGPIHDPELGSGLPELLHEPLDEITALKVRAASIQAAQRFETRIEVQTGSCAVFIDKDLPGFRIYLVYVIKQTGELTSSQFNLTSRMHTSYEPVPDPAPPPWSPSTQPYLLIWTDPSDTSTVSSGISNVRSIQDKSKEEHVLVSDALAYDTTPFVYAHGSINGLSALQVPTTGTVTYRSDIQGPPNIDVASAIYMFLVVRSGVLTVDQVNASDYGLDILPEYDVDHNVIKSLLSLRYGSSIVDGYPRVSHLAPSGIVTTLRHEDLLTNDPILLEVFVNGGTVTVYLNSVPFLTGDSDYDLSGTLSLIRGVAGVEAESSLYVGDLILYGWSPPDFTIETTRNFLKSKWSIQW